MEPGSAANNFTVDPVTGVVRPTRPIDFEDLPITGDPSDRVMELQIREQGVAGLAYLVFISIFLGGEGHYAPNHDG